MTQKKIVSKKTNASLNTRGTSATRKDLTKGAAFNEQDPKRRLGNFQTAGEHARQGGRGRGLVGTDKPRKYTAAKKKREA